MHGSELRSIRKALGKKQAEFGALLGISAGYIGELERGEKQIDLRTARAIRLLQMEAEAMRVSVGTFGDKYVVILSERIEGLPGRSHKVQSPAYDEWEDALQAALHLAKEHGTHFVSP